MLNPSYVVAALTALVPTVGVLIIFWIAMRAIVNADRREREAQAALDAAEAGTGSPTVDAAPPIDAADTTDTTDAAVSEQSPTPPPGPEPTR